jgi:hypothetical protein
MRRALAIAAVLSVATGLGAIGRSRISHAEGSSGRRRHHHLATTQAATNAKSSTTSLAAAAGGAGDADADGLDDETELALAKEYFPYFSIDPREDCSRQHGVLFRMTPHPDDPTKIAIWYVVLYEKDCGLRGLGSHEGDDEAFGELIDPKVPAPAGILAIRAISHQDTTCERVSTCGTLPGCGTCDTAVRSNRLYPVVYSSFHKHGNYAGLATCNSWLCDFHGCGLSGAPDEPTFVNAGEPDHPLVRDLTAAGFVTPATGWSEPSLMHFDPWSEHKFGHAGNVTDDLLDEAFLISPSGC